MEERAFSAEGTAETKAWRQVCEELQGDRRLEWMVRLGRASDQRGRHRTGVLGAQQNDSLCLFPNDYHPKSSYTIRHHTDTKVFYLVMRTFLKKDLYF